MVIPPYQIKNINFQINFQMCIVRLVIYWSDIFALWRCHSYYRELKEWLSKLLGMFLSKALCGRWLVCLIFHFYAAGGD